MFKIFGTDGVRCKVNDEPMTTDTCLRIAKTVGYLLSNNQIPLGRPVGLCIIYYQIITSP